MTAASSRPQLSDPWAAALSPPQTQPLTPSPHHPPIPSLAVPPPHSSKPYFSSSASAVSIFAPPDGPIASSSVSSPSAPDSDCAAEVDDLLEGIDRVRIDDLWTTPRSSRNFSTDAAHPYASLFVPPNTGPFAPLPTPPRPAPLRKPPTPLPHHCPLPDLPSTFSHPRPPASDPTHPDFPRMFKVLPCPTRAACEAAGDTSECYYYHSPAHDRRRPNVSQYKAHMCRFIDDPAGCRKADRCPFSHNDFERRYHPDRFGKETCRDFLRGDCPRRYCTFRHHVSKKVQVALEQMDSMADKEMLQLVLKISDERGRALCDKLLRRFGQGKKHSGWRLEGFNPHGRDDQKVKYVINRVEAVKRRLKAAGEKKWATSLKTSSLRDMMSGVRKVAEEIRERCRSDDHYVENNSEVHRMIRAVFSNTNWSCHSQEGDNPFLVTPDNQNDAITALEKLVDTVVGKTPVDATSNAQSESHSATSLPSRKQQSTYPSSQLASILSQPLSTA